jgi:hypothetical protein
MSGISLGQYKSFLQFIKERTEELNNLHIELNYGDEFSTTNILGEFFIDVESNLTQEVDLMTTKYFEDKINQNIYWLNNYYNEYLVLLHEVGHIVTRHLYSNNELQQNYRNLKSKVYDSLYDAFVENRNISAEKLADNFAIEFTNKYFYEIGSFFTGMSKQEIDEFLGII